ncbi:MAG: Ig-like domain-containing protein, partial [Methanosarcinaceae archaeon]
SLAFTLTAKDPDNDELTYATNATFGTLMGNEFTWTPNYEESGTYYVEFNVTDGVLNDSETVVITVENVNRPPVLVDIGDQSIDEGSELVINLSATDKDGDTLTFAKNESSVGKLTDKNFTWTPTDEDAGIYYVNFSVSDGKGGLDFEVVQITVGDVNRPPVLVDIGDQSIDEGSELVINLSATDKDGDTLTFAKNESSVGKLTDKNFTWTPTDEDAGIYYVNFSVSDGKGGLDFEVVQITVGDVNRPPVLVDIGDQSIDEGSELVINLSATDEDGDTLTFAKNDSSVGTLTDKNFTWTPEYDEAGIYSVNFSVSDGKEGLDFEIVQITVGDVNRKPVLAEIDPQSTAENTELRIELSATDPDGDPLTYSTNATFGELADYIFLWTPAYGESGIYYVEFTASDGALTDSETITIAVGDVNRAPALDSIGNKAIAENSLLAFTLTASDDDGDDLTYGATGLPGGAQLNTTSGLFEWTPGSEDSGVYSVGFNVTDGELTDSETVQITVSDVTTVKKSSSGGGGGGGGGGSPEPASNVHVKELAQQFVTNGNRIRFEFIRKATVVDYVEFDAKRSFGKTTTIIEELKEISVLTPAEPDGEIYRHINIWVGNGGFASPENIGGAVVGFRVNKTWIAENEIIESTIALNRYSEDRWNVLQTRKIGEDEGFIYFEASSPGFSPFAVTAENSKPLIEVREVEGQIPTETEQIKETDSLETETPETEESAGDGEKTGISKSIMSKVFNFIIGFMIIILIGLAVIEKRRQ